jgi:hypothetical protein
MATILVWIFILTNFFFQVVPFKPLAEFEIKFDLSFKQRDRSIEKSTINLRETQAEHDRRTQTETLPYLVLHIKLKDILPVEFKTKIVRDNQAIVYNKKVEEGMIIKLDVGFTDDIKDQIKGYKHEIQFLSIDKNILSRILIEFDKDGNYFVNGEKRGRV